MLKSSNIPFFILTFLINFTFISSQTLKCEFKMDAWATVGRVYICNVEDNGIFDGLRIKIESIEGEHLSENLTNADVMGIQFDSVPNVNYFPKNLANHFKNVKGIRVYLSQLKEIKQSDLKAFPELEFLNLEHNSIRRLENNLFEFNHQLKEIFLNGNFISHIDNNTFSDLNNLVGLELSNNKCGKLIQSSSVEDVVKQIEKGDCVQKIKDSNGESETNEQDSYEILRLLHELTPSEFLVFLALIIILITVITIVIKKSKLINGDQLLNFVSTFSGPIGNCLITLIRFCYSLYKRKTNESESDDVEFIAQ